MLDDELNIDFGSNEGVDIDFDALSDDVEPGSPWETKTSKAVEDAKDYFVNEGYDLSNIDIKKLSVLIDQFAMTPEKALEQLEIENERDAINNASIEDVDEDEAYTGLMNEEQREMFEETQIENPEITAKDYYEALQKKGLKVKDDAEVFYMSLMDKEDRKAYMTLKEFDPKGWDAKQYYIYGIKGTRKEKAAHKSLVREYEAKRAKKTK